MTIKALIRNISLIIALNALVACSESEHYPKQYLGFKHTYREFTFPKTEDTHDIIVTIIATEKSDKDRKVTITSQWNAGGGSWKPSKEAIFQLLDKSVTIPAQKKSANVRLRIFPRRIKQSETVYLTCKPQNRDIHSTQITLKLNIK